MYLKPCSEAKNVTFNRHTTAPRNRKADSLKKWGGWDSQVASMDDGMRGPSGSVTIRPNMRLTHAAGTVFWTSSAVPTSDASRLHRSTSAGTILVAGMLGIGISVECRPVQISMAE